MPRKSPMLAPLHDARQAYLRLDAVAISAKMTAEGLAHMFVAAELLATKLLSQGYFVRGAIVQGPLTTGRV